MLPYACPPPPPRVPDRAAQAFAVFAYCATFALLLVVLFTALWWNDWTLADTSGRRVARGALVLTPSTVTAPNPSVQLGAMNLFGSAASSKTAYVYAFTVQDAAKSGGLALDTAVTWTTPTEVSAPAAREFRYFAIDTTAMYTTTDWDVTTASFVFGALGLMLVVAIVAAVRFSARARTPDTPPRDA